VARKRPAEGDVLLDRRQLTGDYSELAGGEELCEHVEEAIRETLRDRSRFEGNYLVKCEIVDDKMYCEIAENWKTRGGRVNHTDIHSVDISLLRSGSFGLYVVTAVVAD
jgi:hypothetical protein